MKGKVLFLRKKSGKTLKIMGGLYQISNLGRVKSFRASSKYGAPKEMLLKPSLINSGYCVVTLYSKEKRRKYQVHRLVATAFIENPNNLPCVNHKDENKLNNCAENLELCTYQYNNNYGAIRIKMSRSKEKPIVQKTLDGHKLATYQSMHIASELLGIEYSKIRSWCKIGIGGGYMREHI